MDGEEGEHGGGHVVVVELLLGPLPGDHHRGLSHLLTELEIFSLQRSERRNGEKSEILRVETNLTFLCARFTDVIAEKEFPIEQLDSYHSEYELERLYYRTSRSYSFENELNISTWNRI